jgi:hypothetical protein
MRAHPTPASGATIAFRPAATRARLPAEPYAAGLKARLCIAEDQIGAWSMFADALWCNHLRMASDTANGDEPFGALGDRLAALERMRHAGRQILDVLSSDQRKVAAQVLPLCCRS